MRHNCKIYTIILIAAAALFQSKTVCAQAPSLPSLPDDPNVKAGKFSNGISYYLCENKAERGRISFALIQRLAASLPEKEAVNLARERFSMASVGHSGIEAFLARNGMRPGKDGFVKASPGSAVYTFDALNTGRGTAVLDSALLAIFSLAGYPQEQPSSSQAIVVSGDFDRQAVLLKMNMLSLSVNHVPGTVEPLQSSSVQSARGQDGIVIGGDVATRVEAIIHLARLPQEYLKTVLCVASDKLAGELGWVLKRRLYSAFRKAGLPVSIGYEHISCADTYGDEKIVLKVNCLRRISEDVREVLVRELSRLRTWGVDTEEYCYARDVFRYRWFDSVCENNPSNISYMERCAGAFLYGGSLSNDRQKMAFAYRDLPDSTQTRLFNNYLLRLGASVFPADSSLGKVAAMTSRDSIVSRLNSFKPHLTGKVPKLPKGNAEYVTGGVEWVFPGGISVIYKQMPTGGIMHYCFASRGGRQWADPDYFTCIDGVDERSWRNWMNSQGIRMALRLRPSDVLLSGTVPSANYEKMLLSLVTLCSQKENLRVFGPETFKMFVIVGDEPAEKVKKTLFLYTSALPAGAAWNVGDKVEMDYDAEELESPYISRVKGIQLPITGQNYALSRVVHYLMEDALTCEFAGCACGVKVSESFVGFPSDKYNIVYGVKRLPVENFSYGSMFIRREDALNKLDRVLERLSYVKVSPAALAAAKAAAKAEMEKYKATPGYFVDAAITRYLDNRDLFSNFNQAVDRVSAAKVMEMFK